MCVCASDAHMIIAYKALTTTPTTNSESNIINQSTIIINGASSSSLLHESGSDEDVMGIAMIYMGIFMMELPLSQPSHFSLRVYVVQNF